MQIRAPEIAAHLERGLASIYLICGDELLIVEECCDAIIAQARRRGFSERSVHHVEQGFKWHDLVNDAASMSLFAEKKILDVRIPAKKFDREASSELREWVTDKSSGAEPEPDQILLLRSGRLDGRQRQSAWFKAIDKAGVITQVWPVSQAELPGWLQQRARTKGFKT